MTPADKGLQTPERGSAPVEDPAVVAGKEAAEAAAAFSAIAKTCRTSDDENTPEFIAADKRTTEANAAFADASVTSATGALAKMRELVGVVLDDQDTSLDARHIKTVAAFLETVVGGEAAPIGDHPDAGLLARVAEFYPLLEKKDTTNEAWHTRRAEADAMPDCPPIAAPVFDKAGHDRWHAFMEGKGVLKLYDKANAAGRALGKAANRVFAIPARTYRGAVEKVKIAYLATGDGEGTGTSDEDLESYQDIETPWMANAIADLERLAVVSPTATEPDPAVVAFTELKAANAAFDALPDDVEEQTDKAAYTRFADAREAVYDVVPVSMAGVAAKVRAMVEHHSDAFEKSPGLDRTVESMLPFLEGAPAPAPKPDPVVTLFAEWAIIRDEATALSAAIPEGAGPEAEKPWDEAIDRCYAVEDQIMGTTATSIKGVAVKVRLASHYAFDIAHLAPLYATPSRDIDYDVEGGAGGALNDYLVSALRDAERLAGV